MLTGPTTAEKTCSAPPERLSGSVTTMPNTGEDKAMAIRPENRFKTAAEFAEALEESLESKTWLKVGRRLLSWRLL